MAIEREEFDDVVRRFHQLFVLNLIEHEALSLLVTNDNPSAREKLNEMRKTARRKFQYLLDRIDADPGIEAMLKTFEGPVQ